MKYLKKFKIFESTVDQSNIDEICKKYGIENYTINKDGSIDVNGDVNLKAKSLTELPLKFNKVNGHFNCSNNKLTSLEGCPEYINGNFDCSINELKSLEYSPREVGYDFNCSNQTGNIKLTTLKYAPENVGGDFNCSNNNELTTLEYSPREINSDFICKNTGLTDIQLKKLKMNEDDDRKVKGKIIK